MNSMQQHLVQGDEGWPSTKQHGIWTERCFASRTKQMTQTLGKGQPTMWDNTKIQNFKYILISKQF
jgi:hypothetical protein